jgi:hypothetical protein
MTIIDVVLLPATQPLHRLHPRAGIPDFDLLRPDPHLHGLADQPRRHGVGVVLDPDGAAATYLDPLALQRLQSPRWQGPQVAHFPEHRRGPRRVPAGDQLPHQLPVGLAAGEVPAATQEQGLLQRFLEAPVRLFAIPVLMGTRRVGRLRLHVIVP